MLKYVEGCVILSNIGHIGQKKKLLKNLTKKIVKKIDQKFRQINISKTSPQGSSKKHWKNNLSLDEQQKQLPTNLGS